MGKLEEKHIKYGYKLVEQLLNTKEITNVSNDFRGQIVESVNNLIANISMAAYCMGIKKQGNTLINLTTELGELLNSGTLDDNTFAKLEKMQKDAMKTIREVYPTTTFDKDGKIIDET